MPRKVSRPPRVRLAPAATSSDGPEAVELSSAYGLIPDDWQADILDVSLSRRLDGRYACSRIGVSVPRQNGKNGFIEARELFGMIVLGEKFLHTAHEVKTARKAFLRLASFFENPDYPELIAMVKYVRRTNGQEAIVLHNGGSIEFIARTKGSGRGFTVDVLVFDEAQELSFETLAALLPTISAAPLGNPQVIMTGTPPSDNMNGEVFTQLHDNGNAGSEERLGYFEWSADRGVDFDDPDVWRAVNPALDIRLDIENVQSERASLDDASFGRERLGMWDEDGGVSVIPSELWAMCADESSQPVSNLVLALDVSPDRSTSSLAVAGRRSDERWHIEVIDNRNGTAWLLARTIEVAKRHRIRSVVIDRASAAMSLVEHLKRAHLTVITTAAADMAAACGEFYDATLEQRLAHLGDLRLDHAIATVRKRKVGDAWAWSRQTASSDITPVVASTLALWGAQSSRVKRKSASSSSDRKALVL